VTLHFVVLLCAYWNPFCFSIQINASLNRRLNDSGKQSAIRLPIGEDSPLKANALGDLKRRDDAPLDLLAGFACRSARPPTLPARLIEVSDKSVGFDGCGVIGD
jgi:hypothetical protein